MMSVANAGPDQSVEVSTTVVLDGSGSRSFFGGLFVLEAFNARKIVTAMAAWCSLGQ